MIFTLNCVVEIVQVLILLSKLQCPSLCHQHALAHPTAYCVSLSQNSLDIWTSHSVAVCSFKSLVVWNIHQCFTWMTQNGFLVLFAAPTTPHLPSWKANWSAVIAPHPLNPSVSLCLHPLRSHSFSEWGWLSPGEKGAAVFSLGHIMKNTQHPFNPSGDILSPRALQYKSLWHSCLVAVTLIRGTESLAFFTTVTTCVEVCCLEWCLVYVSPKM